MQKKTSLYVIIASRTQPQQQFFLQRAIHSIYEQAVAKHFDIQILVGVDQGSHLNLSQWSAKSIICVHSEGRSQACALNAAIKRVGPGYVAFLEDDDTWNSNYLEAASTALERCDFVSSTQLERNEDGQILRINDFPTPSGWLMPTSTLIKVGQFNEAYRFHLDSEWLGRLGEVRLSRIHLAEATAPICYMEQVRPLLFNVQNLSAGHCRIERHDSPYPLINRLVHPQSGIAQILADENLQAISMQEQQWLLERFGRLPC